ncbi:hypothetical protein RJ640_027262 [Escallonia rubra]|uniref:Cytochrome P450 n=1 Tax=Escallonia rubra TaxID=112253 RepID=A0AA88ULH6_9ASTE|nr:hypothetical protein RJ640_027262 [Escallonia rubra]
MILNLTATFYDAWSWWWKGSNAGDELARVLLTSTATVLVISWFLRMFMRKPKTGLPPGPRGLPLVGNLLSLDPELHTYFASLAHNYGPILTLWLGKKVGIVVTSPAMARAVLKDHDTTFANRDVTVASKEATYGGSDIAWTPYGPEWRMLRKVCVHEMLSNTSLDSLYGLRRREIRQTIGYFYSRAGSPVNVGEQMFLAVLNVITSMLWGGTVKGEERASLGAEFRQVVAEMTELLGMPNVSDFYPGLARFDLQGIREKMKGLAQRFDKIFEIMIDQRLKMGGQGSKDFLQFLLQLKNEGDAKMPLTMTHLKALLMDMVVGGTETTSNTIEFTMAEMMKKPDVMKKAQEELDIVVGKDNVVEESDTHRLPYLNAVMKEVLRLHPALPLLVPHCPSDTCTVGSYTIPKGARVFVNVWAIHRDPSIWENPLEFRPERFLDGKWDYSGNDFNYFPFGSGRRICAGTAMAERLFLFSLASLLHSFDWKLPEGEELDLTEKSGIVLKKKKPLVAIPTPRLSSRSPTLGMQPLVGQNIPLVSPSFVLGYADSLVGSDQRQSYDIVCKGVQGNQESYDRTHDSIDIPAERKKMTNVSKLIRVKRCVKVGKEQQEQYQDDGSTEGLDEFLQKEMRSGLSLESDKVVDRLQKWKEDIAKEVTQRAKDLHDKDNAGDELARVLLTSTATVLVISWFLWMFMRKPKTGLPPGPRGLPLVGNLLSLDPELHTYFASLAHSYGPILTLWLGKKVGIVVTSPAMARAVLKDHDTTFANRDVPVAGKEAAYGGSDIVWTPYGPEWRMLRKVCVREMLSNTSLDSVYALRRREIRQTIGYFYSQAGSPVNVGEQMFLAVLNVITSMLWGGTVKGEERASLGAEFRQVVAQMTELLGMPNVSDFYPGLARFDLQGIREKMKGLAQRFDKIFETMIDQRLKMGGQGSKDFLQFLLQLKNEGDAKMPLTMTHLKALLMDMVVGGTDTTSNSIEFAMAEMMKKPGVMKKAQQELDTVVGKDNMVEESDTHRLPYLNAVMKEALRLHPALPLLVPHCPSETCTIGSYTIPKGARVFVNVWEIHRDPSIWENPLEFRPERFLDAKWDYSGNDFNYFPFGSGRRICAGTAMAERMFLFSLASLLHSFDWKLPEGEELDLTEKFGIVLKKKKPLVAIPTPRLSSPELYQANSQIIFTMSQLISHSLQSIYEVMPEYLSSAIVLLSLSWFAWILLKRPKRRRPTLPPGPRGLPLVGNLLSIDPELHTHFATLSRTYGPIFTLWLGKKVGIVVSSPALAKEVLRDNDTTFANRDVPVAAREVAYGGSDIVWSPYGPEWRMLRKVCLREMLSNTSLDSVYTNRRWEVRQTIGYLYRHVGLPVNVGEQLFLTILNVITNMLWGGTIKGEERANVGAEFRKVITEITELLGMPNISDFYPGLARFDFQGIRKQMKGLAQRFDKIFETMIDQRKKMDGGKESKDFLQYLLQLKEEGDAKMPLTMTHLKALLMDMVVGGTDTTANTIEFALAEMMNKPEVMRKAQQELEAVVGKDNIVEESHIHNLPYLHAIMKEFLRLHPALPLLVPHCPSETCTVGGYMVPKGARVFINVWAIHRDPSIWDSPLEFRPERFLDAKWDYSGNDFSYFPFGSGRRICAGTAMAERMFLFSLASLVHSFEWKMPQGVTINLMEKCGIVLKKRVPLIAIPTPSSVNDELAKLVLTLALVSLTILWYTWIFINSKKKQPSLPPGPQGLPVVGNLLSLQPELHSYFASLARTYGPVLTLRLGKKVCIVVTSSAAAREVLKDHDATFANRDVPTVTRAMEYGACDIVWSPSGPEWRMLRKVCVRGMLGSPTLDAVYSIRRQEIHKTIGYFCSQAGSPVNVGEQLFLTVLNVITNMLWGGTIQGKERASIGEEFRQVVALVTAQLGKPNISDFFPALEVFDLQGIKRQMREVSMRFDRMFDTIIDQRLKTGADGGKESKDFLQVLLQLKDEPDAKTPLTMNHLKALLLRVLRRAVTNEQDMVVGGTDTTSNTIEFAIAEMMNKPEVMGKAQKELEIVVGKDNRVEEHHIHKLPYLHSVMKEVLRLHPALPLMVPHCPSESSTVAGYTIPKGSRIFVNVWAIHRDPSVWKSPSEFLPERFLDGKVDYSGNNFDYFPFGSGRRICAGIAMAERVVMFSLASLLHSFNWELPEGEKLDLSEKFGIVLKKRIPLVAIPTPRLSDPTLYQ